MTVANSRSLIRVPIGRDLDLSCTSTGVPVPRIVWLHYNKPTIFRQVDRSSPHQISIEGSTARVTRGTVTSTLQIRRPRYPNEDGEYVCLGTNSFAGVGTSSTASITVQVTGT